ncbi:MAG: 23S rRNA (adenine(2503)-C(2))-methyltransferase RlmN [Candidatus Omnitrophota bacterium]|jgi:23S rRNA (adenine2503-C2)-methyltransferase
MKIDIKNLSLDELKTELEAIGAEPYRSAQIMRWLYKVGVKSFDEMTDLPEDLRARLKAKFHITHLVVSDLKRSSSDGTTKYLFKLEDSNTIETVFLPEKARATICLSSQVGCKCMCSFCASTPFGFVRNLKSSEILDEVIVVRQKNQSASITNLVFMGIGEPFDNYDNVLRAIRILNDKDAFNVGARKITISTCGIIPGIERLKGEGLQVELSVSLHSAINDVRSRLVPMNKKYPIKELIASCKEYTRVTNRVITFEYVLIKDVNCSKIDADELVKLLKGMKCKVNTISYNRITKEYAKPAAKDVSDFMRVLKESGINATHRRSKGEDIDAACGQLRIARL